MRSRVATTSSTACWGRGKWAGSFITYSDPDSGLDYQAGYFYDDDGDGVSVQFDGFSQFTAAQMVAVHAALNSVVYTQPIGASGFSVEGFTNLGIDYSGSGSGDGTIRVANTLDASAGVRAYAFYPSAAVTGGDAYFEIPTSPLAGSRDYRTILHELGHSLGLKHGHEFPALPAEYNSYEYSVMTYNSVRGKSGHLAETWGASQTWMPADILALQHH
jgi:serralysin